MSSSIRNFVHETLPLIILITSSVAFAELLPSGSLFNDSSAIHISNNTNALDMETTSIHLANDTNGWSVYQGWTPPPNGRGTINIIWDSFSTIFLCCWTALCANIPSPYWSRWEWMYRKTLLFCLAILGPEMILLLALGQWLSARRSVEEFRSSGYPEWSINHAFLADMGGFVLHPRDWVRFPINAKQVHYLVTEGYIPYSAVGLEKQAIRDRNKGDGIVRIITVSQILWFSFNCLGRALQHLAITTLELTTVSFIICTLGTYVFWAHKPMDIETTITLEPNATITEMLIRAGDKARNPYKSTPLDFVDCDLWSWRLYWEYAINILRMFGIVLTTKRRPIDKIRDDNFPPLGALGLVICFPFSIAYAAIPICAWNFYFPTDIERLLWRISSLAMMVCIVIVWIVDQYSCGVGPILKEHYKRCRPFAVRQDSQDRPRCALSHRPTKFRRALDRLRNNSPNHDPALSIPLKTLIPCVIVGVIYSLARGSILIQDIVNLRSLPTSAYDSVNWSSFWPHVW
jgi:hypothetical protein